MQQSFLDSNSDSQSPRENIKDKIDAPKKKMYEIQLTFLTKFKRQIQQILFGIQAVLLNLTNYQQGQKKRLPYNILRSFEKNLKQMRSLKQYIMEENKLYSQQYLNRQQIKLLQNIQFKIYLKQLGNKRQQLKTYISQLQTRVRKLEDTGYAQFVQYDVIVPEQSTIRISYRANSLFLLIHNRNNWKQLLSTQIQRWNKLHHYHKKLGQKSITHDPSKPTPKQQNGTNQQKQIKPEQNPIVPLLQQQNISLQSALNTYLIYKYFINDLILIDKIYKYHRKKQELTIQTMRLKQSIKITHQKIYKQKLTKCFQTNDKSITKTDHLIYLKQIQNQIKQQFNNKIFNNLEKIKLYRSKSWNYYHKKFFLCPKINNYL